MGMYLTRSFGKKLCSGYTAYARTAVRAFIDLVGTGKTYSSSFENQKPGTLYVLVPVIYTYGA